MSYTNDLTEQLPTMPGTDGCAPSVDDGNDVTPLMHAQEVASSLAAIKLTLVNKMNGVAVWYSVGASFVQQPHLKTTGVQALQDRRLFDCSK